MQKLPVEMPDHSIRILTRHLRDGDVDEIDTLESLWNFQGYLLKRISGSEHASTRGSAVLSDEQVLETLQNYDLSPAERKVAVRSSLSFGDFPVKALLDWVTKKITELLNE
jgi:hypothetical protein